MKLDQTVFAALIASALVAVGGCAHTAPVAVATSSVSTTQVTSADVGEKHAPTPKVGKAEHVGTHTLPSLGDDKTVTVKDGARRSYEVFGDWK